MASANVRAGTTGRKTTSHLNRRTALCMIPTIGALPVGAAIGNALAASTACARPAELPGDGDPGLAQLEAGYRQWQDMLAERTRLEERRDALIARAEAAIAPTLPPEPPIPPELAPYSHWNEGMGKQLVWWGTTPRKGKVGKIADAHGRAEIEWRHAHNKLLAENPDYQASELVDEQRSEMSEEAKDLRADVLAIPTTSPRGLMIKFALAIEAESLADVDARIVNAEHWGLHDGWVCEDLLPVLAADLKAMAALT